MEKISNEHFIVVFEEVILPMADLTMNDDYLRVEALDDESEMAEFIEFRGAFQQRLKLFYFKQFLEYKKRGEEKIFPGDTEHAQKDIYFMYVEFKNFLKKQRERLGVELGFLEG
jgi:hypothetical protein